jgi:squalene-associated FAD-dependent desaturase
VVWGFAGVKKRVVVVGGGWAGLSAALELAERGAQVQLFEKRAVLGGRAYSYRAREAGHTVDNGQHLLMGCYHATLRFLDRIGAADRVEVQTELRVPFFDPSRGSATFACAAAPSPLHLTLGAMRYTLLSPLERLRLVLGGLRIALRYRGGSPDTVAQALAVVRQTDNLRKCFWNPLAIAVLNELPERASADLFAEVLRRVFFARRAASSIVFPKVGLSDLCAEPAARAIEKAGGKIEAGPAVAGVGIEDGRAAHVSVRGRPDVQADAVILAVPPPALSVLLPSGLRSSAGVDVIRGAPIVSAHLWFEQPFAAPRMAGFLDGPIHWLFTPPMQPGSGRYVTLVVSGAHDLVTRAQDEVMSIARQELARYFPQTADLVIADSLVVKETNATFAATPQEQPHRPRTHTEIPNLFLAGDWTDTGLPATLESAVVSGERAAAAALEYLAAA